MSGKVFEGKRIVLAYEPKSGPWGGGNQFLVSLNQALESNGAQVYHSLVPDADIIMIINPRKGSGTVSLPQLKGYKKKYPKVRIVHRINETDKAKKTHVIDRLRLKTNKYADFVIFISQWVSEYYANKGFDATVPHSVIRNGPDTKVFNSDGYTVWNGTEPLKIVTHHWSPNPMKGIDIYKQLDDLLADPWFSSRFSFSYIGQLPQGVVLENTKYVAPLAGKELAREIKNNHVYLTAARWESCGMHQLEGMACGLPSLYINEGGGVVETCKDYGIEYLRDLFPVALFRMREEYEALQRKVKHVPYSANTMISQYLSVLEGLL